MNCIERLTNCLDFQRRRMSVIVEDNQEQHILICKGAVEEIMYLSTHVEVNGEVLEVTPDMTSIAKNVSNNLTLKVSRDRCGLSRLPEWTRRTHYTVQDESNLTLLGYLAFLTHPRLRAEALSKLHANNVNVKILTGDNDIVTGNIGQKVGLPVDRILLGSEIEGMDDTQLAELAERVSIFAKLLHRIRNGSSALCKTMDMLLAF